MGLAVDDIRREEAVWVEDASSKERLDQVESGRSRNLGEPGEIIVMGLIKEVARLGRHSMVLSGE